jgi:hypothetical protein
MKLRSLAIAFVASLLIIGCATKQQQQFTPAQTALERQQRLWDTSQFGARPDAKIGKSF